MSTTETTLEYQDGDTPCRGVCFTPSDAGGLLPVVLLCPAWDGVGDEIRDKAARLAEEAGYITFAVDVLGEGRFVSDFSLLEETLAPFLQDRAMLLRRLLAAVDAAREIPGADLGRMGVIGYCFGGTCALDLARSCCPDIRAAASFHGDLQPNGLEQEGPVTAPVLVMHGQDDPLVPPEKVSAFLEEMTAREADWQFISYGHTVHAFTRPAANIPGMAVYSAAADRRSWQAMRNFLAEVL